MKIYNIVRKNNYFDSVTLMLISKKLRAASEDLEDVSVMMGTPANRDILREANLLSTEGETAEPNDLIIAFRAPENVDVHDILARIDKEMAKKSDTESEVKEEVLHSSLEAYKKDSTINIALISVPGDYAAIEAERALHAGKHVMLFSDNVPMKEELRLKKLGREKNLLVMGPDCGTAIINGVGLAFANRIRRGSIGVIGASGTGTQEVTCLLEHMGAGITQAIGTGGRDLQERIGASTMLQAFAWLQEDEATKVILLVSKPPADAVVEKILTYAKDCKKPVVIAFIGANIDSKALPANVYMASSLETAAIKAAELVGQRENLLQTEHEVMKHVQEMARHFSPQQKYVHALYAGGTLCYETFLTLKQSLGEVYSNLSHEKATHTELAIVKGKNSVVDLGDDAFTQGRPHPMIDGSLRDAYILEAAEDPETAMILLDVVLGYGAAMNPAGELVPVLQKAKEIAKRRGNTLAILAYVCGTQGDKQNLGLQKEKLIQAGVMLANTNAQMARMALTMMKGRKN